MKPLLSFILAGLCVYAAATGLLYVYQRGLLYHPTQKYEHPFEEIIIENEGETLSVILLNKGKEKALIYFGGNAEPAVFNAEKFESTFPDRSVYLFNYRGYGGSSGHPTEASIFSDALALYETVKASHTQVSVMGRSLGSGVATYLAANRPTDKLVLVTPYDSILNVARNNFRAFPVGMLLKDKYDSASRVKDIESDVLVIAAEHDRVIPMARTESLVKKFPKEQVLFRIVPNTGHNNLSNRQEYYTMIQQFL